jgi:hypothetical protein
LFIFSGVGIYALRLPEIAGEFPWLDKELSASQKGSAAGVIQLGIYAILNTHSNTHTYTGCNRRNGPNFGRVFLMLNYTEKTQNTYIQS